MIAVAVEGIVDALRAFGIDIGISFSLGAVVDTALGPLVSPWPVRRASGRTRTHSHHSTTHRELKKISEQVAVCQELGTGIDVFSFAIKYLANDGCVRPHPAAHPWRDLTFYYQSLPFSSVCRAVFLFWGSRERRP